MRDEPSIHDTSKRFWERAIDRRAFVRGMCLGGLATFAAPLATFARVPGDGRLVLVLLRGGFDGLAAVVPVGDPAYAAVPGAMAYDASALTALTSEFALGPGVARSHVLADWPGLSQQELFESRDLRPTLDTRSLLKGVARGVFDLTPAQANRIFPDSEGVGAVPDLMS